MSKVALRNLLLRSLASNLREKRIALRFSPSKVARRTGISKAAYVNLELGKKLPNTMLLCLLASALRTNPSELLYKPGLIDVLTQCLVRIQIRRVRAKKVKK